MKRAFLWVTLFLMLFAYGCSQPATSAPGFADADLVLTIGEEEYRCRDNIESVIAKLGDGYEYAEGRSCDYDGLDKTFIYEVAEFYTWPLGDGDIVNEVYTQSAEVNTSKGIAVGDSKQDVLAAYGGGCEDSGWQLIYRSESGVSLCFDLDGDVVTAISLTAVPV